MVYNAEPLGYSDKAIEAWRQKGYEYCPGSWEEVDEQISFPGVEILIVRLQRKVTGDILKKFPDLRKLVSATTGHDHLDVNALEERDIELVSLRGHDDFLKGIPSTAEHTWALLMALIRNIPSADRHVRSGEWNRDLFRGYQLQNKTLGIVGYGRTGKKVAQYARAFGMKVKFYDPYVDEGEDEKIAALDDLLAQAEILSFHVHLNAETEGLLNKKNIDSIKPGAFLINTSRGKIWDEEVVAKALFENKIAGVASDVLATELDDLKQSQLWKARQKAMNVIITPHLGGATWDAMWSCEEYLAKAVPRKLSRPLQKL